MIQFFRDLFRIGKLGALRSPQWGEVRKSYISKNPYCAVCGTSKKCEVHHRIPFHEDPRLELDENNLITLCRDHHFLFGHLLSWKSWNDTVREDSKVWYNKIKTRP